jgi:hydrogenase-4 component E
VIGDTPGLAYDVAHLLGAAVLLHSFALIYQRRLFSLLNVFAAQALFLAAAAAWQGHIQGAGHLYLTALITAVLKGIVIPVALHRIVVRLSIHRTVDPAIGPGAALAMGIGLAIALVLPLTDRATALTREDLALALSVVLLGLLMMISRRNAVSQVVGFMSIENGLVLAAVGVQGMPFVVEMSIAFSVLVAFIIFGIFIFHIRERFDSLDVPYVETFRGEGR